MIVESSQVKPVILHTLDLFVIDYTCGPFMLCHSSASFVFVWYDKVNVLIIL